MSMAAKSVRRAALYQPAQLVVAWRSGGGGCAGRAVCVAAADGGGSPFFPLPLKRFQEVSGVVMDRRGAVLRVFPVDDGKWRMRAHVEELDPDFISALMAYEDKRFMSHGGVDFAALTRAAGSLVTSGRLPGGSTITMQTARLLEPRPRAISARRSSRRFAPGNWSGVIPRTRSSNSI